MTKKGKIIIGTVSAIVVLGLVFGNGNSSSSTSTVEKSTESVEKKEENILLKKKLKTADIMNGMGDTVIGTRAYVEIKKDQMLELSNEQFTEFVNEVVKDSGYNYVTIIAEDASKAIFFPGSLTTNAEYGKVNIDGTLDVVYGYITLQDDGTYSYQEK